MQTLRGLFFLIDRKDRGEENSRTGKERRIRMRKPRVFIASSVEGIGVANAINECLDYDVEPVHWKTAFSISSSSIEDLVTHSKTVDFAVFVFTPDDVSTIRKENKIIARDNVLFELGLFIGSLGKERCFIVKPRDEEMHFPTDLLGLTPADFDGNRSDNDLTQALSSPCIKIGKEIKRLGLASEDAKIIQARTKKTAFNYTVGDDEFRFLMTVFQKTSLSEKVSAQELFGQDSTEPHIAIAAVKLERLGLVEKAVSYNQEYDYEYYTYSVTSDGVDFILSNEDQVKAAVQKKAVSKAPRKATPSFDDDIPF